MKCYIISRSLQGVLTVLCQSLDKNGKLIEVRPSALDARKKVSFDTGNASKETHALALAIMNHYYQPLYNFAVLNPGVPDAGAAAEAARKAGAFQEAFLLHANIPAGGQLEISSDVIDRFFSL